MTWCRECRCLSYLSAAQKLCPCGVGPAQARGDEAKERDIGDSLRILPALSSQLGNWEDSVDKRCARAL